MEFQGFSPETIDFLWGIRMNNNREWFLEHKKDYVNHLYEPMKALGRDLFQPFLDKTGSLLKVSRIYRDTRMHHPLPYKESLWICIRQDVEWWAENPCLFFEITPDDVSYGFAWLRPRPAVLEKLRQDVASRPKAFLKLLSDTEKAVGQPLVWESYKRPKPCENPNLLSLYSWKRDVCCIRTEPISPDTFGPQLGERVGADREKLIPLYDFFNQSKV